MMVHLQINPHVTIAELAVKLGFSDHDACDQKNWEIFGLRNGRSDESILPRFSSDFCLDLGSQGIRDCLF